MRRCVWVFIALVSFFLPVGSGGAQEPACYADLGDFTLENGQVIRQCRLGYRTLGVLNEDRSNAVLFPTWFMGTSQELEALGFVGPGRMVDTSRYYVIAVDALGNGVSTSPSNSAAQPGESFPGFTVRDMVNSQYLLLTEHLNIQHLRAVVGISMGGMQVFQWIVSHPDFMDAAVAVCGTPKMSSYDLLLWQTYVRMMEDALDCGKSGSEVMKSAASLYLLTMRTPRYVASHTASTQTGELLSSAGDALSRYDVHDWLSQLEAMLTQDVTGPFHGSEAGAAAVVKARSLVVTSEKDHCVYPGPARTFADLTGAGTFALTGDCGHFAFLCEQEALTEAVNAFLR